ncbi:signal peptidase II [Mangrovicoccus algicola]|uniref:Lipoprotein signal peptidase n=1 Tax=Mangrovicoccus algicola TaxID=2771008 RepID=A0A8J6ZF38_9RHOB|nr:signal peptidase II [Mangrovicoccus algicola]MBE3640391.1 signal peptidase II [Mangrovicoccus algicola]
MRLLALTAILMLALDQASKYAVIWGLGLIHVGTIPVLPPYLVFHMGWNTGINFGLGSSADARWILVALALAICAWALNWARRDPRPIVAVSTGLLVGGALGNVIDRVIHGAVADFLNMSCCGIVNPYTFNIADIGVFLGAVGLILSPPEKTRRKG